MIINMKSHTLLDRVTCVREAEAKPLRRYAGVKIQKCSPAITSEQGVRNSSISDTLHPTLNIHVQQLPRHSSPIKVASRA
jgi:hypothetical protein